MHPADAQAELESQGRVVAEHPSHGGKRFAPDLQRQFVAVDHHPLDGCGVAVLSECGGERVDYLVEIAAVRSWRAAGEGSRADEAAVARRVSRASCTKHAAAHTDHFW